MRTWAAEDRRREPYARDVAAIYLAYARELSELRRVDADLYAWRALDALRAAPGRWGDDPVFFYGFDDLHRLERDAVETLARVVGVAVTVSLTYEAGRSALGARAEVVEELRPLAERVRELPALDDHYDEASRAALHHLERHLFEPSPGRVPAGGAVRLLEAGGERAEAELIAAEVLGLLRVGGAGRGDRGRAPVAGGSGRLSSACSSSTGSRLRSTAGSRSATPRSAAGCSRSPAARCSANELAPRICSTTCARPGSSTARSSPTGSRPTSGARD